jgi:hypothetical protein
MKHTQRKKKYRGGVKKNPMIFPPTPPKLQDNQRQWVQPTSSMINNKPRNWGVNDTKSDNYEFYPQPPNAFTVRRPVNDDNINIRTVKRTPQTNPNSNSNDDNINIRTLSRNQRKPISFVGLSRVDNRSLAPNAVAANSSVTEKVETPVPVIEEKRTIQLKPPMTGFLSDIQTAKDPNVNVQSIEKNSAASFSEESKGDVKANLASQLFAQRAPPSQSQDVDQADSSIESKGKSPLAALLGSKFSGENDMSKLLKKKEEEDTTEVKANEFKIPEKKSGLFAEIGAKKNISTPLVDPPESINPLFHKLYSKYFTKQSSPLPSTQSMLKKAINKDLTALKDESPENEFLSALKVEAETEKIANVIGEELKKKKDAENAEAEKVDLNPDFIEAMKKNYKMITTSDPDLDKEIIQSRTVLYLSNTLGVTNKILQNRYLAKFGEQQENEKIKQENEKIKQEIEKFKQDKFEKLFDLISCNPDCLSKHIPLLAKGLIESEKNKIMSLKKDLANKGLSPEEFETKSKELDKGIFDFSDTEIEEFQKALSSGVIAKVFPNITSKCGVGSSGAATTSSPGTEATTTNTAKTEDIFSENTITEDQIKKSLETKKFEDLPEILKNFYKELKKAELLKMTERVSVLSVRRDYLLKYIKDLYFKIRIGKLKNLITILNKADPNAAELIVQKFGETSFDDLRSELTEEAFNDYIETFIIQGNDAGENEFKELKAKEELEKASQEKRAEELKVKLQYIEDFKARNGKNGEEFIDEVLNSLAPTKLFTDFEKNFPKESKEEFFLKVLKLKLNSLIKPVPKKSVQEATPSAAAEASEAEAASAVEAPQQNRRTFKIQLGSQPQPWELELNRNTNKFDLNKEGMFVNSQGIVVNVFGEPIEKKGGYRRRQRRRTLKRKNHKLK